MLKPDDEAEILCVLAVEGFLTADIRAATSL
jgi:hypothetical protein